MAWMEHGYITNISQKIRTFDGRPAASCICLLAELGPKLLIHCPVKSRRRSPPPPPPPSTLHPFCAPLSSQSLLDMERPWAKLAHVLDHFHVLLTSQKQYKAG